MLPHRVDRLMVSAISRRAPKLPGERFHNLSEVAGKGAVLRRQLKILFLADDQHVANVVVDHIQGFLEFSHHRYTVMNPIHDAAPAPDWLERFDVVLIHYSIYILGDYFLPEAWRALIEKFDGLKAQIIQDEHRSINAMSARMAEFGIAVVFSSLEPGTARKVYKSPLLTRTSFFSCLPGYVAKNFFDFSPPPIADRPLHIVYRGRTLPAFLGRFAQEKFLIGEQMKRVAEKHNLEVDISSSEDVRIYGTAWPRFLMSGRATLGVEGGASIFDFDGSITQSVEHYRSEFPDADFEQIWHALLQQHEGNVVHRTLTPKLFEAIAAKTALILYPGRYRDILEPGRHYIELARDGSNTQEVVGMLRDSLLLQSLVNRAHEEVLSREDVAKRFYVERIDLVLAGRAVSRLCRRFSRIFTKNGLVS